MSILLALIAQALHVALLLAGAPVLIGLSRRAEARLMGRSGPPVWQPLRDLRRLARKQPVIAETASWLFRAAPLVHFAAIATAAALVPSFATGMATAPLADLLVIGGLMGLARLALGLGAMDVGTAFGGMGAGRTMAFAALAEPASALVVLTLALLAGTTNLDAIAASLRDGSVAPRVSLGLALLAMLAVAVAENGRNPVDGSASRMELSMVDHAMTLEYSGRHLALLEAAGWLKLLVWLSLIGTIFAPFALGRAELPLSWPAGMCLWAVNIAVLGAALALLESVVARMRLFRVPEFLGLAVLLGILGALFLFVGQGLA